MENNFKSSQLSTLDQLVGQVAGSICIKLMRCPGMQQRQFMLLPAITYKVKLCLHRVKNKKKRSDQHLAEVAKDIRSAIVPLMWVFDFPADLVYKLGPTIEKSSLAALLKAS